MQYDFQVNILIINIKGHTSSFKSLLWTNTIIITELRICKGRYISQEKIWPCLWSMLLQIRVEKPPEYHEMWLFHTVRVAQKYSTFTVRVVHLKALWRIRSRLHQKLYVDHKGQARFDINFNASIFCWVFVLFWTNKIFPKEKFYYDGNDEYYPSLLLYKSTIKILYADSIRRAALPRTVHFRSYTVE